MVVHVACESTPGGYHFGYCSPSAHFDEFRSQPLLDWENRGLEPLHQRQTLAHRAIEYHREVGVPVLQRASDQTSRAVDGLDDILVALARRVRTVWVEQVITVLDDTVVVNQTRSRDSPHTLVHGLASGSPASSVLYLPRCGTIPPTVSPEICAIRELLAVATGDRYTLPVPEMMFTNPSPPATLDNRPLPSNLVS